MQSVLFCSYVHMLEVDTWEQSWQGFWVLSERDRISAMRFLNCLASSFGLGAADHVPMK